MGCFNRKWRIVNLREGRPAADKPRKGGIFVSIPSKAPLQLRRSDTFVTAIPPLLSQKPRRGALFLISD
ncbi:MAG: hypothetical protein CSA04_03820 [Bacteroidetes bacterium]|nr:MAG: hypothetical protein CSA04_03820 [Bacteroidota bacterium]